MVWACAVKKEDNDWVKKCMENKVEGAKPRMDRCVDGQTRDNGYTVLA